MKKNAYIFKLRTAILVGLTLGATGCATSQKADSRDPWEGWNRSVQSFNDKLDDYVMKPVARGYKKVTPEFVDSGVTNFFSNIDDINVLINDLLQFKLAQTGMDTGRFLVNTTTGLGGFVDVASKLDLPKHHEDLDQTGGLGSPFRALCCDTAARPQHTAWGRRLGGGRCHQSHILDQSGSLCVRHWNLENHRHAGGLVECQQDRG